MELREVKASDIKYIEEIIELERETFGVNGGVDYWILKPLVKYGKVYVALEDDKVIGAAQFMNSFEGNTAYLYGISINQSNQSKGIAKQLLEFSEKNLKEKNIKNIELTVAPENEKAIKFYIKLGYEVKSLNQNEYGFTFDRYIMVKKM